MAEKGIKPAALLVDTIFSSDGIFSHPKGFLKLAVEEIRAAGGLFIADEVQPGFARTGEEMWGFARHGLVPDMVLHGQSRWATAIRLLRWSSSQISSHHLAIRRAIFNTFGGKHDSHRHGSGRLETSSRKRTSCRKLWISAMPFGPSWLVLPKGGTAICDIRGAGLFIGVQMDPAKIREHETTKLVNGLKKKRILISSSGAEWGCFENPASTCPSGRKRLISS